MCVEAYATAAWRRISVVFANVNYAIYLGRGFGFVGVTSQTSRERSSQVVFVKIFSEEFGTDPSLLCS